MRKNIFKVSHGSLLECVTKHWNVRLNVWEKLQSPKMRFVSLNFSEEKQRFNQAAARGGVICCERASSALDATDVGLVDEAVLQLSPDGMRRCTKINPFHSVLLAWAYANNVYDVYGLKCLFP